MTTLSTNLKNLRLLLKFTQDTAAELIGIKRSLLGAYEEGRANPPIDKLIKICEVYGIDDLYSFISNPNFPKKTKVVSIETRYRKLKGKEKRVVDVLLGVGD